MRALLLSAALLLAPSFAVANDQQMISLQTAAEKSVRQILLDPESARFEGTVVVKSDGIVCGFVNAKNRMGGYAGRQAFIYWQGTATLITELGAFYRYRNQLAKCGFE